ncbi:mercury resistance system periplasmic binding protein MerP [soil metagenome]
MTRPIAAVLLVTALAAPMAASAAQRTVTLSVPTMDCDTCPITIRAAVLKVPGVDKAVVSYRTREARITYDDARTDLAALTAATADAGYPSFEKLPR